MTTLYSVQIGLPELVVLVLPQIEIINTQPLDTHFNLAPLSRTN